LRGPRRKEREALVARIGGAGKVKINLDLVRPSWTVWR